MADNLMETENLNKLKLPELKKRLKDLGQPTTGNKAELISRLQAIMSTDTLDLDDSVLNDDDDDDDVDEETADKVLGLTDTALASKVPKKAAPTQAVPANSGVETKAQTSAKIIRTPVSFPVTQASTDAGTSKSTAVGTKGVVPNGKPTAVKAKTSESSKLEDRAKRFAAATTSSEDAKIKKVAGSDEGAKEGSKLEERAKRFGGPSNETSKKAARAERFGIAANSAEAKSAGSITSFATPVDVELLKKRAERFGTTTSTSLTKVESVTKLKKRAERFGAIVAPTLAKVDSTEKLLKRKERFGSEEKTDDVEAAKKLRAERFALKV